MRVVGYVRVSTEEQGLSGAGLEAQRRTIRKAAKERGWDLVTIHEDTSASGKSMDKRPGLKAALADIEGKVAEVLLVSKLDRLSRSLLDFAELMERSRRKKWAMVALDLGVDTTTPSGEMMANVLAVFAQFERRLIGERTKAALAIKRSEGVTLGRPRSLPTNLRKRIVRLHRSEGSFASVARLLTAEGVPTAQGGQRWYPATVKKIVESV